MDIPVVLSHKTAWLLRRTKHFSQLCDRARQRGSECGESPFLEDEDLLDIGLGELGLPAHTIVQRVRDALHSWGVPVEELNSVDVLVPFANDRVRTEHLACHSHGQIVHEENVIPVARGLLSVGNPLCFAQAATWMNRRELIEFGYELCADYFTPFDSSYVEHKPYSSCNELEARLKGLGGVRGTAAASKALASVKDGSRSPMETATAMMIACPRLLGGLEYRNIALNGRVDVPHEQARYTSSSYYEVDILASMKKVGVEYDGGGHDERSRRGHDAERLNALSLMGFDIKILTSVQFSTKLNMHRAMNAIARSLGIKAGQSIRFQRDQDDLRRFVIRHWDRYGEMQEEGC